MREWGGEAVCLLVQAALKYTHQPPLSANHRYRSSDQEQTPVSSVADPDPVPF